MRLLVTGGAGFIGSALCRAAVAAGHEVLNLDKMTYASTLGSTAMLADSGRYALSRLDICDADALGAAIAAFRPDAIANLAAETHVDQSIDGPRPFLEANIVGAFTLLEAARSYWGSLAGARREAFRLLHVSTDEVYGSLGPTGRFTEETPYAPSSPYSASKAAADHLVLAWRATYGLPALVSNCSNNYGPFQFPEKLIPLSILNALEGRPVRVYGDGGNVRDWLHVEDHAEALLRLLERGRPGEKYNVGGASERTNLQVVEAICDLLDDLAPPLPRPRRELLVFVEDRPGHDRRYAVDAEKIARELGWRPDRSFEAGLAGAVSWYLENPGWWRPLRAVYSGGRLGLAGTSGAEDRASGTGAAAGAAGTGPAA